MRPDDQKNDKSTTVGGAPSNPYKPHDLDMSWKDGTGHVVEGRTNTFGEKRIKKS